MKEIVSLILEYASIWMPSVTAILGIVTTTLLAVSKVKTAIDDLKKTDELAALCKELKAVRDENKELKEQYDILIDEITKIKNYRESLKR